jgi:hypothetical protein
MKVLSTLKKSFLKQSFLGSKMRVKEFYFLKQFKTHFSVSQNDFFAEFFYKAIKSFVLLQTYVSTSELFFIFSL